MGYCLIVPKGSKSIPENIDDISFFKPQKGDKVFVTVEKNGGKITSYTLMKPWLRQALEKYPKKITYALGRAVANDGCDKLIGAAIELERKGKYKEALSKLKQVESINSGYKIIYKLRGEICLKTKKYKEALANCKKAIELDSSYSEAYFDMGKAYAASGDLKKAVESFEKASKAKEGDYKASFAEGVCLMDLKQYEKALKSFEKTLLIKPDSVNALLQKGKTLNCLKEYSKAYKALSRAIQINAEIPLLYYQRGVSLRSMGKYEEAKADFIKFSEMQPKDPSAFLNIAYIDYINKDYKSAITNCDKVINLNPETVNAYYYRGGSYLNLGNYDKAASDFSKIAELEPDNHAALGKLGMCLYIVSKTKNDYAKAEEIFKKALKLNPKGKYLPLWIYLSESKQGKANKAVLEKALSGMPENEWMANIYKLYLNKTTPAECFQAIRKFPRNKWEGMKCEALFYIAELALTQGNAKKAAEYFRKCAMTKAESYLEHIIAKIELEKLKKR
jgi:tetratricopeptide (TPR) repeat protein